MKELILLAACLTTTGAEGTKIVAHRGSSQVAPENTLASVRLGWEQADAVEIDIQLTADGQIVAIHDKTTKRTGGLDRPVVKQTLAELQQLDFGSWKSPQYAGERIPTLKDILATIPDGKRLFIEIKTGSEILSALKQELQAAGKSPEQTPIICFSYEVCEAAKKLLPELKVYWLVDTKPDKKTGKPAHTTAGMIEQVKAAGLDGLDLGNSEFLDQALVDHVRAAGLELYVWTVNDLTRARELKEMGLHGITTDVPKQVKQSLKEAE